MVPLCCESDPLKPEGEGPHGGQQSYSSFISFRILILSLYLSWFLWEHSFHLQQEHVFIFKLHFSNQARSYLCVTKCIILIQPMISILLKMDTSNSHKKLKSHTFALSFSSVPCGQIWGNRSQKLNHLTVQSGRGHNPVSYSISIYWLH